MIIVTQGIYNDKTVTSMNKILNGNPHIRMSESTVKQGPLEISSYRYNLAIQHMILLRSMEELNNDEVKRLISQLQSPDPENWTVAEECIKQKLS